ncbi:hypothetical protein SAMN06269185_2849 [Natronoarchaeum philippinense]|uniref:Uncharacterized protein n=1 Tax=Natronoarchaeum philippinense TaxID=558529 RepID=A0A285P5L2_NATPI|nr:rod-determining factor RdfA [Natronoarchaeum philippinense]SNZ17010.1 hypothetical protein SAMN06269185_2849 [Natronoarchaeum philippinense]
MNDRSSGPGPAPKVARIIQKYDLDGFGDELEARWTQPDDRESLRDLADRLNEHVVRAALADADVETLTDDVQHLYEILNGDAGSAGEQTQVARRLERQGVDVDSLTDDFASYQAVRTYLTNYRGASLPDGDDEEVRETEAQNVEQLRQRTATITDSKVDRLVNTDRLEIGPHRILADVQVLCESCGKQYDAAELFRRGSCECGGKP